MEIVGGARVLVVVDQGCQKGRKNLQIREPVHEARLTQHMMDSLCDIGCMQVVVIRIVEATISLFDSVQEGF